MGKEQKLKMKEAYDLFILIFMSCNRRKSKQCPFALGEKSPCKEKYILNKAHKVRQRPVFCSDRTSDPGAGVGKEIIDCAAMIRPYT